MADGWSEMRQDRPATKKLEPRSHCDKSNGSSVVTPPPSLHTRTPPHLPLRRAPSYVHARLPTSPPAG